MVRMCCGVEVVRDAAWSAGVSVQVRKSHTSAFFTNSSRELEFRLRPVLAACLGAQEQVGDFCGVNFSSSWAFCGCSHGKTGSRPLPIPEPAFQPRTNPSTVPWTTAVPLSAISIVCERFGSPHLPNAAPKIPSPHFQGIAILTSNAGANDAATPKTHCW